MRILRLNRNYTLFCCHWHRLFQRYEVSCRNSLERRCHNIRSFTIQIFVWKVLSEKFFFIVSYPLLWLFDIVWICMDTEAIISGDIYLVEESDFLRLIQIPHLFLFELDSKIQILCQRFEQILICERPRLFKHQIYRRWYQKCLFVSFIFILICILEIDGEIWTATTYRGI